MNQHWKTERSHGRVWTSDFWLVERKHEGTFKLFCSLSILDQLLRPTPSNGSPSLFNGGSNDASGLAFSPKSKDGGTPKNKQARCWSGEQRFAFILPGPLPSTCRAGLIKRTWRAKEPPIRTLSLDPDLLLWLGPGVNINQALLKLKAMLVSGRLQWPLASQPASGSKVKRRQHGQP